MKLKKVIAAAAALLLIGLIATFASSFMGNPISGWLANRAAKDYVAQTYPHLNLTLDKAFYNFKFSEYIVHAACPTSIDTQFALYFNSKGQFVRDDYETYVLGGFNTWQRLDTQYRAMTDSIFESPDFPYPTEIAYSRISDDESLPKFELDKEYDISGLGAERGILTLYVNVKDPSAETMARVLTDLKAVFDKQGVPFAFADVTLQLPQKEDGTWPDGSFAVSAFPYEDIGSENMQEKIVQNAKDLQEYYAEQDKEKEKEQPISIPT